MALFRNGEVCIFSLSPKLKRNQKPYSFLLSKNQGKIFTVSVPAFALIALINFLGLTFYSLSEILTEKAPNELILVVSVSVALFTFFLITFYFYGSGRRHQSAVRHRLWKTFVSIDGYHSRYIVDLCQHYLRYSLLWPE